MSKPRKFMNIDRAVEFLEAMKNEIPTNCQHETDDIIELLPETVDEMSDSKEFDDKEIGETQIVNVPGNVEVYVGTDDESDDVCEDQASIKKSKRAKIVLKEIPKWKKSVSKLTVPTIDNYNNKPIMEKLIREFSNKNTFQLFMLADFTIRCDCKVYKVVSIVKSDDRIFLDAKFIVKLKTYLEYLFLPLKLAYTKCLNFPMMLSEFNYL